MQDQILQIVQLIQYSISQLFSMVITNNFIGEEVTLDENSVCGYKMMGFNSLSAKSVLAGEKLVATYSIST
jgi:hypothetical protein